MQLSIEELKSLIIWAKEQKVKVLEVSGIKVEFTELAFIENMQGVDAGQSPNPKLSASTSTFSDDVSDQDDEDLLFHSSRP